MVSKSYNMADHEEKHHIMNMERPMPRMSEGRATIILASWAALAVIAVWLGIRFDQSFLFSFLLYPACVIVAYGYVHWRRCPQCRSWLVPREDYCFHDTTRHRWLLECARCAIAWDIGEVVEFED